ncbi:MAG TPA: hypothetical protein VGL48_07855 [Acidimicrobiales bacterium]|jgi:hypothetical protein
MPRKAKNESAVPAAPTELPFRLLRQTDTMAMLGGISRWTLNRIVSSGELPVVMVGETPMYDLRGLERYVRRHTVGKGNEPAEATRRGAVGA